MQKKYNINYFLKKLPYEEYSKVIEQLPIYLGVSKITFYRWRTIRINDDTDLPAEKLRIMAVFFGVSIEDMHNKPEPSVELVSSKKSKLAKKFNLSK